MNAEITTTLIMIASLLVGVVIGVVFWTIWDIIYAEPYVKAFKFSQRGNKLVFKYLKKHTDFDSLMNNLQTYEDFKGNFCSIKITKIGYSDALEFTLYTAISEKVIICDYKSFNWKNIKKIITSDFTEIKIEAIKLIEQ